MVSEIGDYENESSAKGLTRTANAECLSDSSDKLLC